VSEWKKIGNAGFIAEIDGRDAGDAWTKLFENAETGGYGFVDHETPELCLVISEKYRGIGVGTALMQTLLEELKVLNYKKMSLSVDKATRAINLYKRLEFKVIKEQETDLLMVNDL